MKKLLTLLILVLSMTFTVCVFAQDEIKLNIDGNTVESDVAPQIIEGRTMVPVRVIFEGIGAKVSWDNETKTITGEKNDVNVVMKVDSNIASVMGKNITMDCGPVIIEGRTLAPARYVAEAFGCDVSWDGESRTVNITTPLADNDEETTAVETTTETTTVTTVVTTFETTTNPMYNYDTYYKPGTYRVGTDMPAGEYVVFANPDAIGYLYKYAVDGNVGNSGKRYLYNKYFDYCDVIRLDEGNYLDLSNAYAVPGDDVTLDTSHNGAYRAGKDIKTGHLTFRLSSELKAGYVDVGLPDASTADRTIVYLNEDHSSVVINVTAGMYVKVYGCDILDEKLTDIYTFKPVTENNNHTDAKFNFEDITPQVKKTVDDFLTSLVNDMSYKSLKSTKYTDSYYKKTAESWNSLAKTSADRKYVEIAKSIYTNIKDYAKGTNIDVAYATTIKVNGKDISGVEYRNILDAEKKLMTETVSKFKNGTTFMELEAANTNLKNYRSDVPRLTGSKVN